MDDNYEDKLAKDQMKQCIILLVAISVILIAGILYFKSDVFKSKCTTVIDMQCNNKYTVELLEKHSLSFLLPFGGRDGKVVLKDSEGKEICSVDIFVQNDGGSIHDTNWRIEWEKERVLVIVQGLEDPKEKIYYLYYDGKTVEE